LKEFIFVLAACAVVFAVLLHLTKRAIKALEVWVRRLGVGALALLRGFASGGIAVLYPGRGTRYTRLVHDLSDPVAEARGRGKRLLSALATGGVSIFYESGESSARGGTERAWG